MITIRRMFVPVVLCLVLFGEAHAAYADAFTLSGVVNKRLRPDQIDESGQLFESFALEGTMELSTTPTIVDLGDRYQVQYEIGFRFLFNNDITITGGGSMIVDGNGCGLFDCNMAGYADSDTGHRYFWTVANGAFFYSDGNPYPDVYSNALSYAVAPASFQLNYWDSLLIAGPTDTGNRYSISTITATRTEAVPEPSVLLLMGLGAAVLTRARRKR